MSIPSLYSALGYRAVLPTFKNHVIYEQLGLPEYLYKQLILALEYPQWSTPGTIGTLTTSELAPAVREVDCLQITHSIYSEVTAAFTASVSAITQNEFGLTATPCGAYGIFRYNSPTGHYIEHCDAGRILNGTLQLDYPCRNVSFIYYPHNDFTGGELEITTPLGSRLISPKPDHFVLFPSDPRYPHKVYPTLTKSRVAIVNWFSLQGQTDMTAHEFVGVPKGG